MLRRDYLVRMIEEMTEMIGKVFGLKQERKFIEALWEIDDLYKDQFRLNSNLLRSLSARDITEMFRSGGVVEADKLQSLAYIIKEEANIYYAMGKHDEGVTRFMKALHLYLTASLNGADRSLWNLDEEVKELLLHLKGYRLPTDTDRLLFRFEEEAGRFDQAENVLFRLLQDEAIPPEEGIVFYDRLLVLEPQILEQGGLPLSEVKEGLAELQSRFLLTDI
ncbi:DUF6483 family protein [Paenibacillus segetis]|uniref:Tetratricopeptide repeat-containing protein n=1 Tax=Paenibacillus segetis TaxID=1325360 RepID=A0ABQ1YWS1_9BACL|nr:DUF6483 family protein [Paenibacillus segetis]GGH38906.1 hypothetical protein GCM10008013_47300 [Paenibacillus segetis]